MIRKDDLQRRRRIRAVARYDTEHKAQTRRRIIETAGRRFKQDGIDGSGVAALMADAGLTNGAFYAHFESKDDLVANVVADQLATQRAVLAALPEGRAALEGSCANYLSPHHRDDPGTGCPNAALLDEIGRCGDAVRDSYTKGMQSIVDVIATHLSPRGPIRRPNQGTRTVHGPRRHPAARTRRLRCECPTTPRTVHPRTAQLLLGSRATRERSSERIV